MNNRREIPNRQSNRLPHYDYSQTGAYFVTIVTWNHTCLFGDVVDDEVQLNAMGRIVDRVWREIPAHFPGVTVEDFVVMPNHVHGVILIDDDEKSVDRDVRARHELNHISGVGARHESDRITGVGARHESDRTADVGARHEADRTTDVGARHASPLRRPRGVESQSLGAIVGSFKSAVTKQIHQIEGYSNLRVWHRNYYERVIRDEREHEQIVDYIHANPMNWAEDSERGIITPFDRV